MAVFQCQSDGLPEVQGPPQVALYVQLSSGSHEDQSSYSAL
jgi:hypothetical protein